MAYSHRREYNAGQGSIPGTVPVKLAADAVADVGNMINTPISGGSAGYGVTPTTSMTTALCRGVVSLPADNTGGSNGDKTAECKSGTYWFKASGTNTLSQANVGQNVYAESGDTVGSSNLYPVAGTLVAYDATQHDGCYALVALACAHLP